MTTQEIISKNIFSLRKQNNLTQAELADKLSYTEQAISKWERGLSLPDAVTLLTLSEIFGVSIEYMYTTHEYVDISNEEEDYLRKREVRIKTIFIFSALAIIALLSVTSVNMILDEYGKINTRGWIFALPGVTLFLFILNYFYGKKKYSTIFFSITVWTTANAIYGFFMEYAHLIFVFVIAAIVQIIVLVLPLITKHYDTLRKQNKNKKTV